ncbi:unnamed protein product [Clonostachys rosea f. rosea IK726]|uniref:Uncharacterized protein n=1 Tax=Clonostachys rosea f. rosea IK726 TaxID=1349383 RepID=A0ACA9U347_BIOOC|nr:unnamed protein product [Clonostachys rosea f. rosea IK726]
MASGRVIVAALSSLSSDVAAVNSLSSDKMSDYYSPEHPVLRRRERSSDCRSSLSFDTTNSPSSDATSDRATTTALDNLSSDTASDRSRSDYYSPRQSIFRHDEQPPSDTTNSRLPTRRSVCPPTRRAIAITMNSLGLRHDGLLLRARPLYLLQR